MTRLRIGNDEDFAKSYDILANVTFEQVKQIAKRGNDDPHDLSENEVNILIAWCILNQGDEHGLESRS